MPKTTKEDLDLVGLLEFSGGGTLMDIVLGGVGAIADGWLFHTIGVTALNFDSFGIAVVGTVVFLIV